ncbi:MAG: Hydrolase, alpha/beta fold family [uncultured Rubrobacteraceae bacterium]|uniref:Hydrolase, alpha/beta fold family n=1 Tax=uncultured Rubrobacteraceae bacterium TaxID=349277 RepID=A0A6J4QSP9_9ACTN|nr:MAG: Hydrolase, alpha/beta fold family [uncultured Rubrobacteraceae bacterium]
MNGPGWNHGYLDTNGINIHYVRQGSGTPLVLLHGWPEFWMVWRKNIPALSEDFDVVAPDLRGFGETDRPGLPDPPSDLLGDYVEDLRGLADALGLERFGIVSHDVGAYVAQGFARKYPDRLSGLFFFNCPYPGIGRRWVEPDHVNEIWYQTFNQQPWAASLVGENRKTCETYIRHFLDHWAHKPGLFDEDLDLWVENFMKPGNLQGGFDWYVATNASRIKLIRNGPPEMPKIETPTRVLWGRSDSVLKVEWADRLGDYFANHDFTPAEEAGHFVHYERPELANREIAEFFRALR